MNTSEDAKEMEHFNCEAPHCGEQMAFPDTFEEFIKMFQFIDKEEIYTNKAELIPVFRVMQGWEHFNIQSTMIEDEIKEKLKKEIYEELFALTCKWKDNYGSFLDFQRVVLRRLENSDTLSGDKDVWTDKYGSLSRPIEFASENTEE